MDIGSAVGRAHGVTDEQLLSLDEVEKSAAFAAPERLAIRLAVAMTRQPVEVPDALFAELRGAFSDAQIVELASAIAWENYRARFNHTFGLEAEGFMENAVCVLPPPAPSAAAQVAES